MVVLNDVHIIPNATKADILNQLASREDVRCYINDITKNEYLQEELYQELILAMCEVKPDKLISIYKADELNEYILGILYKMSKTNTTSFYRKIKRTEMKNQSIDKDNDLFEILLGENITDNQSKHMYLQELDNAINKLHFYDKNILKDYMNLNFSIKNVSNKQRIHKHAISQSLNATKKHLKEAVLQAVKNIEDNKI